jgi:transposase InsO family protein
MDQRVSLIGDWLGGEWTVLELSERYGISRKTAYKWIDRYRLEGSAGLLERSHAPRVHGRSTPVELAAAIIEQKLARPSWGPRKIMAKLEERYPEAVWPVPSTAGEILKREGLVQPRRRRHRVRATLGGLTLAERPNHVWATDHKGWFRLGNGERCEPLTIGDGYARYLLGLTAGDSTRGEEARAEFERSFEENGLPEIMRSDNGSPFASPGVTGLTRLSAWWAKLGIRHERTAPGKPQQNGRQERFHLTLLEAIEPPAADRAAQAARFAEFRAYYNHERPHEALGQTPPARRYQPSPRPLPKHLPEPEYPREADIRRVRSNGEIKWAGDFLFVSEVLVGEWVAIEEHETGELRMRFYNTPIGVIDPQQKRLRRVGAPARRRPHTPNQSPLPPG